MRLTTKERILLHLLESGQSGEAVEVSAAQTQAGMARGAGVELRHLIQFVRPLIRGGLVRERTAHVTGRRQRMKVYDLSPAGHMQAIRLREKVRNQVVRIRDGEAVRNGSLHEVLQGLGTGTSLLEVVRQVEQAGFVDVEAGVRPPEAGFVEQLWDAPRIKTFVGRREELEEITREDDGARVFVIRGMAGIGKSSLASRACDLVRGRRNLFWHRIRPWESSSMVLADVGRFLAALDRPGLASVLKRGQVGLAGEVLRQDLPDTHAFLVLDDAHEASPETLTAVRMVVEAAMSAPDVRALILTRRALPLYDVRDVVIRGGVHEIELEGLEPGDVAALLMRGGDSVDLVRISRRLAGHPLLIELVRCQNVNVPGAIRDVHRFIEETIYRDLSEAERITMKAASLYRVPVPRAALLAVPGSSYEAILALQERTLLRFVGGERYEAHDTVRDFFAGVLTPGEARSLGALAVGQLRGLAAGASASGDFVSSVDCLSNAIRLAGTPPQRAEIAEDLGDAEERVGDLPAALVAYREALPLTSHPVSVARIHRKIATAFLARGETVSASAEIEAALRSLGTRDDVERGWLSLLRGRMSVGLERWAEAREHAREAIESFRAFRDVRGQTETLVEQAVVETNSPEGSPDSASRCLEEALRLSQVVGDPALLARVQVQFANLYAYRLGNADRAMERLADVEALPGALADVRSRQSLLMLKGWLNLDLRADFDGARASFLDALVLSKKAYDPATAALARLGAAVAAYHAGDCVPARHQLEAVGSELLELGYAGSAVEALWMDAEICLVLGDLPGYRKVAARLKEPALAAGLEARPVLAHSLQGLGSLASGDREGVHAAFSEAIRIAEQEVSPQERSLIPFAHDLYGVVLKAMGDERGFAEQQQLAVDFSRRFGLRGRLVVRTKFLDGLYVSLRRLMPAPSVSAVMR